MLKRRDAFLKKSALAVSVALLLSSQALAQAYKTLTDSTTGIIWIDNGTHSLESATVVDRNGNFNSDGSVTGKNFAVGSDAIIWDADKSMAVGNNTAVFNADSSVALGYGSQVNGESNVLSVGAGPSGYGFSVDGAPETRRIINVSDGINNTDAATVGQLNERFDDAQVFLLQTNERIDETDKRLSTVHAELSRDIIAGTSAAVTYTDVTALALQDEIKDGTNKVRDELKAEGDSLRGEIGGVYRDARAHTDSQVTAVRDELKAEGDSLRGEIGGVYRDALKEAKSQAEHLSDVLVKNRAQTDAAIASNTAAIRNNSHRLDLTEAWQKMATERMNNMQEQIKENRKELRESAAQSAALAGLFQPYSVGKFNATAAVGGYRDEQAIAVGVGYRFTENVAGKVAVAAGGSSASWNAGVNFEF